MPTIHPFYILVVSYYLKIVKMYVMNVTVLIDYTASFFILVLPPSAAYQISAVVILGDATFDTNSYAARCLFTIYDLIMRFIIYTFSAEYTVSCTFYVV